MELAMRPVKSVSLYSVKGNLIRRIPVSGSAPGLAEAKGLALKDLGNWVKVLLLDGPALARPSVTNAYRPLPSTQYLCRQGPEKMPSGPRVRDAYFLGPKRNHVATRFQKVMDNARKRFRAPGKAFFTPRANYF